MEPRVALREGACWVVEPRSRRRTRISARHPGRASWISRREARGRSRRACAAVVTMWAQPRCPAASGHRAVTTSRVTHLNGVPRTAVQTRGGASCAGLGGRRLGMSLDALRGTSSMARRGMRPTSGRRRATYALASSDTEWGGLSIPDTMPALVGEWTGWRRSWHNL